jgi:arylsulfatase
MEQPYIKPQWPLIYDLSSDPHEDSNLFNTDLANSWMLGPPLRLLGEYEQSVKKYPNIQLGAEFKGYPKSK